MLDERFGRFVFERIIFERLVFAGAFFRHRARTKKNAIVEELIPVL